MAHQGIFFVLVGPSGAGKNTLMRRVRDALGDLQQLPTMTTRGPRTGEVNGREHWFVSQAEFHKLVDAEALLEWQRVHGDDLYGTPRQPVEQALESGQDLVADIEFLGADEIQKAFPNHTVLVFVTPSRLDILVERIKQRGNISPEELAERVARARFEMTFAPRCAYVVLNDVLETAAENLLRIVQNERLRRVDPANGATLPPRHTIRTTVIALIEHEGKLLTRSDSTEMSLPAFQVEGHGQPLDQFLGQHIEQELGQPIRFNALLDDRFNFIAPNDFQITCVPPTVHLDFYYRCKFESARLVTPPGWTWRSPGDIKLPAGLGELVPR